VQVREEIAGREDVPEEMRVQIREEIERITNPQKPGEGAVAGPAGGAAAGGRGVAVAAPAWEELD